MIWSALLGAPAAYRSVEPPITCAVKPGAIIVRFFDPRLYAAPGDVADKFAVVQGSLGGEWRYVVDDGSPEAGRPPLRFSPYRPTMKRLMIDTRRQLAVRYATRTGKAQVVRAFPRPGRYTLVFSDNLETDLDNMNSATCTVRLK